MCGIAGFIDFNKKSDRNVLQKMTDVLFHRGPDDSGYAFFETLSSNVGFGHRRLSIIDLSIKAHQPMWSENENYIITYNGEIYNYIEIKKELETDGYKFFSTSDTEVVLNSYIKWGTSCVHRFRGMFAFAIYDKTEESLIVFRDRIGVKPLYWYYKNNIFLFTSELKSLHEHPDFNNTMNMESLSLYLQYGYIKAPFTIFKDTFKLLPGHFLVLNKNGDVRIENYWNIDDFFAQGYRSCNDWMKKSEQQIENELEDILIESFKLRMVSDVPVGVFLSGGIDSTLLTALLQNQTTTPLKTFTIGFHEKDYNEAEWSKKIAQYLGTDHHELYCTPNELSDCIMDIPQISDEPLGDPALLPNLMLAKLARSHVKVALSADGGDEQFAGYSRYWIHMKTIQKFNFLGINRLLSKIFNQISPATVMNLYGIISKNIPVFKTYNDIKDKYSKLLEILKLDTCIEQYDTLNKFFLVDEIKKMNISEVISQIPFVPEYLNDLEKYMCYDIKTYLPDDIMTKVDRTTMNVSLEGREPFLDHKVLEYTSQIPIKYKYNNKTSKYILKKILSKYLPGELIDRPKMGFNVPVNEWFKSSLGHLYKEFLNEQTIRKDGIFNYKEINEMLKSYSENKGIYHTKLWLLFNFQLWKKSWLS